jgi:hypothetical protein
MKMKHRTLATLAVVYALVAFAQAQSPQTAPAREDVIRTTYAKLMFANQVGAIEEHFFKNKIRYAGAVLSQVLNDNVLTFELSNFKEGNVPCSQAPMSTLASNLGGKPIINLQFERNTFDVNHTVYAENDVVVQNTVGQVVKGSDDFVICDLNTLSSNTDPKWSKYVTYDVVATYKGSKTKYHASFVFDEAGGAMACDSFVMGLTSYIEPPVYPEVLLNWTINENHDIAEWARANSATDVPSKQMSCNPKTLRCLIPAQDIIEKPRNARLPPDAPPVDCNNPQQHDTSHQGHRIRLRAAQYR